MAIPFFSQLRDAIRNLDPEQVRADARRPLRFGILAADEECVEDMLAFLRPTQNSLGQCEVVRIASEQDFERVDVGFSERGVPHPQHFFAFDGSDPSASASALLDEHESEWLALACNLEGFRPLVTERLIWKIAKENALFTICTSLPNVVPTVLVIPWAVGEFASDTAFLTMNQVRLSLLLAAAHGNQVGYDRQTIKIGSIIGAALGWRAIARQIMSKVPAGGGLVSKGLVALAGTYLVGRGLDHWFREGSPLGKRAQREHFERAYQQGREAVERMVEKALGSSRPAAEPA